MPVKIDFLGISSFSNHSGAPGVVRIAKDLDDSIEGEDVLLVEDIVDTGFTSRYLLQSLAARARIRWHFVPCSTGAHAGSCRFRWSSAASRFPTVSWWALDWITGSCIGIWGTLQC